ncbi:DUF6518 family protein [Streptomyces sp. NE06-03E]|uniref:Uncharacterized protein n=1 Tax=Streptomyces sp. gb1(2016) TaxID=1828321 RepID=A0A652LAQ0_9ACTN|nr:MULTISPECIES: DUF6518 family protein [unclassified Streptomyces]MDX3056207.1 DUF6518 family protein [Streptomyces sp. NE06-03E]TXS32970.1 hypothetical protein EAO74_05255 [Streptomyces sp. gb1(2016)]
MVVAKHSGSKPQWPLYAFALTVGLAGGVLTSFGQSIIHGGWNSVVNSAAPWVTVALVVGLRAPKLWRRAAAAGLLSQIGLVAGYYVTAELRGFAAGISSVVIWLVVGAVAGPVYGAAGALLQDDRRLVRTSAAGVTGSVWVMEGLQFLSLASDSNSNSGPGRTAAWCYLATGVVLPLVLARTSRDRIRALLGLGAAAGAAVVARMLIEMVFMF